MAQALVEILRCDKCGFIVVPDAIKCPKCNAVYKDSEGKDIIGELKYFTRTKIENVAITDTEVIRAYYQLTCPRHGRVNILGLW